jgi:outer membrane protein assembly factor BamB
MKFKRMAFPLMLLFLALVLSACGNMTATQGFPGVVVFDETLYLSEGLHVYAVNTVSGQEVRLGDAPLRFPKESDNNINLFAPVARTASGQLIFPNSHPSEHSLYSVSTETGAIGWEFEKSKGTWVAGALVVGDDIYAPGGDGILYALDGNGNVRWEVELSPAALWSSPVSDGELLFQATMDGNLYALALSNGRQAWQLSLDAPVVSPPVLDGEGNLYVGTLSGNIYAIDSVNGKVAWQQKLEGSIWGAPALTDDRIYVGTLYSQEGRFYALQKANGATIWQRSESGSIIASPLAFEDQVIYVTEAGRVQALTRDGSPRWQADLKGKLLSAPAAAGDLVIVAPLLGDYLLVAFDVNGAQRWTFKP